MADGKRWYSNGNGGRDWREIKRDIVSGVLALVIGYGILSFVGNMHDLKAGLYVHAENQRMTMSRLNELVHVVWSGNPPNTPCPQDIVPRELPNHIAEVK